MLKRWPFIDKSLLTFYSVIQVYIFKISKFALYDAYKFN